MIYALKKRDIQYSEAEIEEQKRKLEEEKEEFKRKTEVAMAIKMQEQQKEMEAIMWRKIEELEAKMKQMEATSLSTPTEPKSQPSKPPLVRIFMFIMANYLKSQQYVDLLHHHIYVHCVKIE